MKSILSELNEMLLPGEIVCWTVPGIDLNSRFCSKEYGGGASQFSDCDVIAYSQWRAFFVREYDGQEWIASISLYPDNVNVPAKEAK